MGAANGQVESSFLFPSLATAPAACCLGGEEMRDPLGEGEGSRPALQSPWPQGLSTAELKDLCFVVWHADPSAPPGLQECREVGLDLVLSLSPSPSRS